MAKALLFILLLEVSFLQAFDQQVAGPAPADWVDPLDAEREMEKFIAAAGSQPRSEEELFGLSEDPWTPLPDAWVEGAKKASVDWRTWPGGRNATTSIKKQCGEVAERMLTWRRPNRNTFSRQDN